VIADVINLGRRNQLDRGLLVKFERRPAVRIAHADPHVRARLGGGLERNTIEQRGEGDGHP